MMIDTLAAYLRVIVLIAYIENVKDYEDIPQFQRIELKVYQEELISLTPSLLYYLRSGM